MEKYLLGFGLGHSQGQIYQVYFFKVALTIANILPALRYDIKNRFIINLNIAK